jgi:uncharacterized protein DUF4157
MLARANPTAAGMMAAPETAVPARSIHARATPQPLAPRPSQVRVRRHLEPDPGLKRQLPASRPSKELTLPVNRWDDAVECDAERIADRTLVDEPFASGSGSPDFVETSARTAAPRIVNSVVASPGRALDLSTRGYFEPRLGLDLSTVHIHDDATAAESARAVGADAYTVADHIAFADGTYAPSTELGLRLLAHELAHVAQRTTGRSSVVHRRAARFPERPPGYCPPRAVGEVEASRRDRMDVREVTSPTGAEDVLIANFAIERARVKGHPTDTDLWRSLVAEMEAQPDERWELVGFSDCSGAEAINDKLRHQRATAIYALLPPSVRGRVTVHAAPPGEYMTGNENPLKRSWNRSVIIRHSGGFKRVALPAEAIEARPKTSPSTTKPKPSQGTDMWPKWKDRSWLSDAWDDVLDAGKWALRHTRNLAVDAKNLVADSLSDAIDDAVEVGKWAWRRAEDLYHAGKWTAKVLKGGVKAAWSTVEGLAWAVRHPVRTIQGLSTALTHPVRTAKAVASTMLMTLGAIGRGDPEAIGATLFFAATILVPGASEEALEERLLGETAGGVEEEMSFERVGAEVGTEPPGTTKYRSQAKAAEGARDAELTSEESPGFQSHSSKGTVQKALGLPVGTESAHVVPQAVYEALQNEGFNVSAGKAKTLLVPQNVNTAIDAGWKAEWRAAKDAGRRVTVADVEQMVSRSIDGSPNMLTRNLLRGGASQSEALAYVQKYLNPGVQGALRTRLHSELFQELQAAGVTQETIVLRGR